MGSTVIHVRLKGETWAILEALAGIERRPLSQMAAYLITEALDQRGNQPKEDGDAHADERPEPHNERPAALTKGGGRTTETAQEAQQRRFIESREKRK